MLTGSTIVAFVATTDSAKALAFYQGILGLDLIVEDQFAIVFDVNGVELRVQKVQRLTPHSHTQLGWSVASIEETVRALRAKGVVFEIYPFLHQNADGVWVAPSGAKVAWVKDPDGNLLSLTEPSKARVERAATTAGFDV
jgi:catechol 2,3-dioxygenase-like lactoylglutathione lyase family enzyme